jgi:hypothetical protein
MRLRRFSRGAFCLALVIAACAVSRAGGDEGQPARFLARYCFDCHQGQDAQAGLDLQATKFDLSGGEGLARWIKIYDRIQMGEMPPKDAQQPDDGARKELLSTLHDKLVEADKARLAGQPRTPVRRLTRVEYENTIRDLFQLDGIALQGELPDDGTAHGFDKNVEGLDISHVLLGKYYEAADRVLDMGIATRPQAPAVQKQRISLANPGAGVAHVLLHGDAVMLKDKKPDPAFPPAGIHHHIDQGAHQQMGMFHSDSSVGLFRHEDESFQPYFLDFGALYPGKYRMRISLWSFHWDKGQVLPSRGIEAGRLSIVHLTNDGRHTGHPSDVIGYYDAPSLDAKVHEVTAWLNRKDTIGFNAASLVPGMPTRGKGKLMGFEGPGIAVDWFEIEGPLHEVWPPKSHQALFGDLPLAEFKPEEHPTTRPPARQPLKQVLVHVLNRPDPEPGIWTVKSERPLEDADRLLAAFLPKAFRRPVPDELRALYVAKVDERLRAGDCFETAMRWAYRAALCSPDFLYHVEPSDQLDGHSLACRLSYFLWNSMPDDRLTQLARDNRLNDPEVLRGEVERMLADPKCERFIEDFLGQWLSLRKIAATDPDRKLYPEHSGYLQDSMVAETRAYFRELLTANLDITHLVRSDFAMLNEKLARHYGLQGVEGTTIRRVPLPDDCPRGGFLTQASILKITANGTTTSPVPRGAFVLSRILGQTPEPPPPNITAIEPDVRGTTTIREQLDKHRADVRCAACHRKMDPPGFALEAFDVIGGYRNRYRSIGEGDGVEREKLSPYIDRYIGIPFRLGPPVDSAGEMPDGQKFSDIRQLQAILAADSDLLLGNLTQQFAVYSTGRPVSFSDRADVAAIVAKTQDQGGGVRTLVHEFIQSKLFQTK